MAIAGLTLPNYYYRTLLYRKGRTRGLHLHLGCGTNYLPGFVNIDANPRRKIDLWLDVRNGLPFPDGSVESVYSTHMLEHLFPDELQDLLRECARVLKVGGGGMRIVVPSLGNAIRAYTERRRDWFDSYPRRFDSLGGKLSNFLFCDGQHRTAFDSDHLQELLRRAGFSQVEEVAEGVSRVYGDGVPIFEMRDCGAELPVSLYVEAVR